MNDQGPDGTERITTAAQAPADGQRVRRAGPVQPRRVLALARRHVLALRRTWKVALTWFVVEPWVALMAVALGIGQLVGTVDGTVSYAEFVAPGIVMGTAMFHALGDAAWAAFDRVNKNVYETQLTAPVTVHELVAAEFVHAVLKALLSTVSVGGLAIALGWIPLGALPGLLLVSVGVGAVFAGIGQLFAATAPTFSALTLVFSMLATPLFFFSGTFFPISVMPDWLEPVAWAAPLTPLVQMGRAVATGAWTWVHWVCAGYVIVFAAAFYGIAVRAMQRRLLK
jgi:lipooligosaccharide transport system permease protein